MFFSEKSSSEINKFGTFLLEDFPTENIAWELSECSEVVIFRKNRCVFLEKNLGSLKIAKRGYALL